jgi:hypothetical protein
VAGGGRIASGDAAGKRALTAASVAANLGAVALFALPGLGLSEMLEPVRCLAWWRRLAYAYLLGVAVLAGTLFAISHLFGVALRLPAIAAVAAAPIVLGIATWAARAARRRRRVPPGAAGAERAATSSPFAVPGAPEAIGPRGGATAAHAGAVQAPGAAPSPPLRGRRWRGVAAAAMAAMAAVVAGILVSALSVPLADWDGRMTWGAVAAYMRHEGTVDISALRDVHYFMMVPRYPPLLPVAQAAMQEALGARQDEEDFRAFYVVFLAVLAVVIQDGARRVAGSAAATLAAMAAVLPPILAYGTGGATSAYSDLPLAALYGAALVWLLLARPRPAAGLAAGCLLAGTVLAKNEGELLAAAALLLAALRLLRLRPRPRQRQPPPAGRRRAAIATHRLGWFAAAAFPAVAAALLLTAWRADIPDRFDPDYHGALRLTQLLHGAVARLPQIVPEILRQTFGGSTWLGFWAIYAAVLLAGVAALRRRLTRRLLLAGLAPLAIGWAAYAVSEPPANLVPLVSQTWCRFLFQALVPLSLAFACALAQVLRAARGPRPRTVVAVAAPATGGGAAASAAGGGSAASAIGGGAAAPAIGCRAALI